MLRTMARLGYWRLAWMSRSLEPRPDPPEPGPEFGFEILDADDAEEWAAMIPGARPEVFRKWVQQGQRCFAARHRGRLVSIYWAAVFEAHCRALGAVRKLPLEDGEVYVRGSWTRPELRGRGLQQALMSRILERFRREGYRRVVGLMVPENVANVPRPRAGRPGFARTGTLHFLKLGPWRWELFRGSRGPGGSPGS